MIEANVVHAAYLNGVKKLVFLGSSCIYPRDAQQPLKEDYLLTSPLEYTNEPYAIAKIAGLKMCEAYNLRYGTDFIAVMPTNLYGPNDNFNLTGGHVMPSLMRRIHLGKLLENGEMEAIREDLRKRPVDGFDGHEADLEIMQLLEKHGVKHGAWGMEQGDALMERQSDGAKRRDNLTSPLLPLSPSPLQNPESTNVTATVWGTGSPLREFMYSGDMADATIFVMERISFKDLIPKEGEIRNTHINIGTGEEITIANLATMLKETTGFRGSLEFDHSKPDGTPRKFLDSSKLHGLGFRHSTSLKDGAKRMYEWYIEGER
jgi:GDP-L-fucose synthase